MLSALGGHMALTFLVHTAVFQTLHSPKQLSPTLFHQMVAMSTVGPNYNFLPHVAAIRSFDFQCFPGVASA